MEKKDITEKLIDTPDRKVITFWSALKELVCFSLPVIGGFAFFPVYLMVNAAILGRMDNMSYLIAYGLAFTALGLVMDSIGTSLSSCVETLAAQAFGAGEL